MTTAFLNGDYLALEDARISPLDRGFLFGDGIYEVIPSYQGRCVGFSAHMARMRRSLDALSINDGLSETDWQAIIDRLLEANQPAMPDGNIGLYLHVSRGADVKRHHAYPDKVTPTIFAFAFEIPAPKPESRDAVTPLKTGLAEDLRWQRCHIKSTSLLGNVMHYQQGHASGYQETILYNRERQVTEASSCNVFMMKNNQVFTPPLDHQLLPGITRALLIASLERAGVTVNQTPFTIDSLLDADEVWLTSSSKEVAPVTEIAGHVIGGGEVGQGWETAIKAYHAHKFQL